LGMLIRMTINKTKLNMLYFKSNFTPGIMQLMGFVL
jgi:hypothetical protein